MPTARRAHGDGSYRQRPDGLVELRFWLTLPDGTRARQSVYAKSKTAALAKRRTLEQRTAAGRDPLAERQTVAVFLDRWLVDVAAPRLRPRTLHRYRQLVDQHLTPALGRHRLGELAPQHVQRFISAKLSAGLAPATVLQMRAVLRRALNQAQRWGLVTRNVATLVDPPRLQRAEIQPFTPEQAKVFLAAIAGDRIEALYVVAIALGLRQGELLGLRWADLDLDAGTLSVRGQLQRYGGEWHFVDLKTARGRRVIALPAPVVVALRAHRTRQLEERLRAGQFWQEYGLVFTATTGAPLHGSTVAKAFQRCLREHDLPRLRFHDLRHTAASLKLALGDDLIDVKEALGHSQISITADLYTHLLPARKQASAERMARWLEASGKDIGGMSGCSTPTDTELSTDVDAPNVAESRR